MDVVVYRGFIDKWAFNRLSYDVRVRRKKKSTDRDQHTINVPDSYIWKQSIIF